jgi:Tfp pilus assembly protein PilX
MSVSLSRQNGAALFVSLVILVLLTFFVFSMTNTALINTRIVGAMQSKEQIRADAQQAIEQVISSSADFTSPAAQTITVNGISVSVAQPECLSITNVPGYFLGSATQPSLAPVNTIWDLQATATDPLSGATVTIHQGVSLRLPLGSECP